MKKVDNKFGSMGSLYRIILLVFFGTMIIGQFGRIYLFDSISIYTHEIVLGWLVIIWLLDKNRGSVLKSRRKVFEAWGIFLAAAGLSLILNAGALGEGVIGASLYLVRLVLYSLLWPILSNLMSRKILVIKITEILKFVGGALALGGLGQYLVIPDTTNLVLYGWDDHLYRAVGTLFDPNFLGLMIVLTIVLLIIKKPIKWWLLGLLVLTLGLTYSRSAFLSLAVAIVVMGWLGSLGGIRRVGLWVGLIAVGIWLLPNRGGAGNDLMRTFSINQRWESQKEAVDIWMRSPIYGVGFNAYNYYMDFSKVYEYLPHRVSGPDNSFLLILSTTGLMGTVAFGNVVIQVIKAFGMNKLLMVSLVAIGTHSLFNNSLFYPYVMVWMFSLLAEASVTESI